MILAASTLLHFAFSQRPPPNISVRMTFAGPSMVEANGVLFTLTNQTPSGVVFELWLETGAGFRGGKPYDRGEIHPCGTYTFHVFPSGEKKWRVVGDSWEPATLKPGFVRSHCVQLFSKLKLDRLAFRFNRVPPNGRILGPEMVGERPSPAP